MLVLCEKNRPLPLDDYCVIHRQDGLDELEFSLSTSLPEWQDIGEETRLLETSEQICYLVKAIRAEGETAELRCQIDLDDWKDVILGGWDDSGHTAWSSGGSYTALTYLRWFSGSIGWTIEGDTDGTLALPMELEGPTRLDGALALGELFGIYLRFDNRNKVVTMVDPAKRVLSNSFAAPGVNLSRLSYTGASKDFATRLYPTGKDGLTIRSVNNNIPYLEDHTFSDRIICAFMKDERCATPAELLNAAQKELASCAVPQRSWQCRVTDLYRIDPETWGNLPMTLFTVIRVVDERKGTFLAARIAEDKVCPNYPHKNEITVSTVPGSLQRTVRKLAKQMGRRE